MPTLAYVVLILYRSRAAAGLLEYIFRSADSHTHTHLVFHSGGFFPNFHSLINGYLRVCTLTILSIGGHPQVLPV